VLELREQHRLRVGSSGLKYRQWFSAGCPGFCRERRSSIAETGGTVAPEQYVVDRDEARTHRREIAEFVDRVAGSSPSFTALSYEQLWREWEQIAEPA